MTLSDRYTRILISSSAANLANARKGRLRLAAVRSQMKQLRLAADSDEIVEYPPASTPPESPVLVTPAMKKQLVDLGYKPSDIKQMTPEAAQEIIASGVTKEKREEAATRREEAFDALEEKVLEDLDAIKKRLDRAKKRLTQATEQIQRLDAQLETVEGQREDASPEDQNRLQLKSEWIQGHIDRAQKAEDSIRREIEALDKLVVSISKTEDGLINELQEANDAALLTPGTDDDEIIDDLMLSKMEELQVISDLRKNLFGVQKKLDSKMDKLLKLHQEISNLIDAGGDRHGVNTLRDSVRQLQTEVDALGKEQNDAVREIIRHEDSLRDVQTEQRLQELNDALKDIPEDLNTPEKLKQKAKEQVADEDVGKDIASKPKKYKQKADAMLAFADTASQHYGDFILSFLAPDLPSDPKVEKFIHSANSVILQRAGEAKKLADSYGRNPMQRSAILLVPSLYEFLASTMDGLVTQEARAAAFRLREAEALYADLTEAGFVKEAIGVRDIIDSVEDNSSALVNTVVNTGKGLADRGKGAGQFAWSKTKQVGKKIQELVNAGQEALDRLSFNKKDLGDRRDPAADLKQQQKSLRELQQVETDLQQRIQLLGTLQQQFHASGDEKSALRARDGILQIQSQLKTLGEKKDVLSKGLSHSPESGLMKGQEQAARRPKNDYEQAVGLMALNMPKLLEFLKEGIPDDTKLETELLRQSDRIVTVVNRMIQEGFKAKKKYPNLPPTIQAYGHMFLAIDDTLSKALRSNRASEAA